MVTKAEEVFNDRLRQVLILVLLIAMTIFFLQKLSFLIPGFLGAVTLFILARGMQETLVKKKKWKKGLAASLFLFVFSLIVALPFYLAVQILVPRIRVMIGKKEQFMEKAEMMSQKVKGITGMEILSPENGKTALTKISNMLPDLLNGTALALGNFILILFLGYFMLVFKDEMEKSVANFIPLKDSNVDKLGKETVTIVRANAIGLPIISLIQGAVATLGYWIFGVEDFVIWGFLTGLFAFFPLIGTAMIWVPVVVYQFSTGENIGYSIGLAIYSAVVIANVDYFARISILKRIGDVHPIITILGVILGLQLFGFWGFIFGPLLLSLLILLVQIYVNEFGSLDNHNSNIKIVRKPRKPGANLPKKNN